MFAGSKNKKQNRGSHLKDIRGSAFRRDWISKWLDNEKNKSAHYKDAVKAYIKYKTNIAERWAAPLQTLLDELEPWESYEDYDDLLKNSKENVNTVAKALTATEKDVIDYEKSEGDTWEKAETDRWMNEEDKYLKKLKKPSGKTGKWIKKLKTLCEEFKKIESEKGIVAGLEKIVKHCTYKPGEPEKNDKLPLYMYPSVQELYAEIAKRLIEYSKFVAEEMKKGYPNKDKTVTAE